MVCAFALRTFKSPIEVVADLSVEDELPISSRGRLYIPETFSSPVTSSLKMRPILSTLVTIPVATNVAQTLIASDASSGDESGAKAGVRAELICA